MLKTIGLSLLLMAFLPLVAAEGETVVVTAEGRGNSRAEAITAAYRNAVAQQVGVILKERTELDNDKVKSQILTLSNGFIAETPPESAIEETKVGNEVHVRIHGVKVYVEKMKKRMLGIYCATFPLTEIRQHPEKFGYQKFTDAYTRMLIDELDDYSRIFQAVPVNKVLTSDRKGKMVLVVNFLLAINPVDYKNYLESLCANLARMNFVQAGRGMSKGNCIINLPTVANASRRLRLATNLINVDCDMLAEHYIGAKRARRQLIYKMELLDSAGEIVADKLFFISNAVPINYSSVNRSLTLNLPERNNLNRELHLTFDFTAPEDATRVSSVRITLHYDIPDASVERLAPIRSSGFFHQN